MASLGLIHREHDSDPDQPGVLGPADPFEEPGGVGQLLDRQGLGGRRGDGDVGRDGGNPGERFEARRGVAEDRVEVALAARPGPRGVCPGGAPVFSGSGWLNRATAFEPGRSDTPGISVGDDQVAGRAE